MAKTEEKNSFFENLKLLHMNTKTWKNCAHHDFNTRIQNLIVGIFHLTTEQ
jgi:hypothetical protein